MTTIGIVGSTDRQIEDLLRAGGMHAKAMALSDVTVLAAAKGALDVLVVDTRNGEGIPQSLSLIKRQQPDLGVVIVAAALDPDLMLEAMRAGVNELVADPVSQSDLERAVGRVLGQRMGTRLGKVYGFVGAKGGVGTTTVAVNVAAALSRADRNGRVLLIDMHQAGGDDAVFVGAEPKFSILDAVENTHRLDPTYFNGLVIQLASRLDLLASADQAFAAPLDSAKLRTVIEFVSRAYQYVVLDLSRSDAAVLDSLDQAAAVYIVANQELATVKSATRIASALKQRFGKEKIKVLLSRSDRQADIGLSDVERAVGVAIEHSFPSDYRAALQALNKGRPLVFEGENSLAESFLKFASTLTDNQSVQKELPVRGGLFSRLTQSRKG